MLTNILYQDESVNLNATQHMIADNNINATQHMIADNS